MHPAPLDEWFFLMADETEVQPLSSTFAICETNEICWISGQKVAELQAVMHLLFAKKMDRIL